jgi:hypothetical protein
MEHYAFMRSVNRTPRPARKSDCSRNGLGGNVAFEQSQGSLIMRTILLASAVTLALGGTAFAQMCGGGSTQQTATTAQAGGMSCMGMQQAQADPMAEKSDKPMMAGGMCPCCKNMAMMGGMKQDGDTQPKKDMPMAPKQ